MSTRITRRVSWGLLDPYGAPWHEAFVRRSEAIAYAVRRCIGAHEYDRLGTDAQRWKLAYRRGYRVVRVTVTPRIER